MKKKIIALISLFIILVTSPLKMDRAKATFLSQTPVEPGATSEASTGRGYVAVPAAAFLPIVYENDNENHGRFIKSFNPAPENHFRASVQLPHGAIVKQASACFYDDSSTNDGQAVLWRGRLEYGYAAGEMATMTSATSGGYIVRPDSSIDYPTVDDINYTYYIDLLLPQSTGAGNNVWGCGAFIEYDPPATEIGILNIPGASFKPFKDGYNKFWGQSRSEIVHFKLPDGSSGNGTYLAQVDLPYGAVVQKMTLHYNDASTEKTIYAYLMRSAGGVNSQMASIGSVTDDHSSFTTTISNATVDSWGYDYWVYLDLPIHSPGYMVVYGMTIEYAFPAESPGSPSILAISAPAFTGFYHDYDYENHGRWLFHLQGEGGGGNSGKYLAPVYLPQGAIVNSLWSTIYDGSNTLTGSVYLFQAKQGVNELMASATTPVGGTPIYQMPNSSTFSHRMIDNTQYTYYAYWSLPVSTVHTPPGTDDIVGVDIKIIYYEGNFIYLPVVIK